MRVKSADDMMATWGITLEAMWHGDCQYFGNAGLCGPQLYRYERQFAQCETWLKKKNSVVPYVFRVHAFLTLKVHSPVKKLRKKKVVKAGATTFAECVYKEPVWFKIVVA